jgi:hypothetical protein
LAKPHRSEFRGGGEFLILVDRNENTSRAEVRRTLRHESCHVFVDRKEPEEHGPMFSGVHETILTAFLSARI